MKYSPHDYQKYAIRFILDHPVAAIFLDCGLGKTSITLTAIEELMYDRFEVRRVLVVAPLRVARNSWPDEIKKWDHTRHLTYSVATGTEKERLAALKADTDICIINRENLQWLVEKNGYPFDMDMIVLDEISSFKNWQSKRFRALMKIRPKVSRIVGLSATPSSNGLMDLYAEFRALDMGKRLGRFIGQYREAYFRPDRMNGPIVYSYKPLSGAEEKIYEKISDITISMRAEDHLRMPELVSSQWKVSMSDSERKTYEAMKRDLAVQMKDGEVTAANAAALTGKLSQLANGAVYTDTGEVTVLHDRKLDALEDIIEARNGKPLLTAYWFRHDLERIERRLSERKIPFERIDSDESIRRWNDGKIAGGLIHPASAGHGLNLQGAKDGNCIVWFGIPWSLELYTQTIDRIYRQGHQSETVIVEHIVTEGTIDERILEALKTKNLTQDSLIAAVRADLGEEAKKS